MQLVLLGTGLLLLAMEIAGWITEFLGIKRAPFGYEDDSGFHFGRQSVEG